MHRFAPLALATLLAASAPVYLHAQTPQFTDPANLRGERVSPRTGRELPIDKGTLGLEELLRQLNTRASILNIVAHPDDEDGGMLTLYARGLGARVADLSLTRGEGGQNAMTADFEDALGLLRTQELLANDRYTGVSQMFGTEVDFGFSKTKAEAFSKWGHQRVLYDAVRAIRLYRPLVITATFIGNPTDGHGQHQVSGEIAQEAFLAAGDPNVFPELTKEGILPWQPLKIYARVPRQAISTRGLFDYATGQYVPGAFTNYVTGVTSSTPPTPDILVHEGTTDPLLTTCAANASDLPASLRLANSSLSSRSPSELSSRSAAEGSASPSLVTTTCRPLTYVQFARIGLGLQKSQIGPGVRNAPSGRFDVPYHLYGSRIQAPTARPVPAQGEALGTQSNQEARAEGPLDNPALTSQPNFFDGIDTSLDGILSLDKNAPLSVAAWTHVTQSIAEAQKRFDPRHPETIAPLLADALANMDLEIDLLHKNEGPSIARENLLHELRIKRVQLNNALALSLGIRLEAYLAEDGQRAYAPSYAGLQPSPTSVLTGTTFQVRSDLHNGNTDGITITQTGTLVRPRNLGAPVPPSKTEHTGAAIPPDSDISSEYAVTLPAAPAYGTRPYFTRQDIEQPYYTINVESYRLAAQTPPPFDVHTAVSYSGATIHLSATVTALTHSTEGAFQQPLTIAPELSISLDPRVKTILESQRSGILTAILRNPDQREVNVVGIGLISASEPEGQPSVQGQKTHQMFETFTYPFNVPLGVHSGNAAASVQARTPEGAYTESFRAVGYLGLPTTNFYRENTYVRLAIIDLKLPPTNKRRIAYLPGTGDDVPAALASIGLKPTILTVADLTPAKLKSFDTVILGVRTYNAHPDLHGAPTQALLDFARSGGNVLVQYQSPEFTAADAPYPLELGRAEKVVDETAPVVLLTTQNSKLETDSQTRPAAALLTTPNRITSADFNGWIEERGHGFLESWDPHYTALTETHDPGSPSEHVQPQTPQRGGLITVQLGKGRWTYCAFALYRQLPEAVPGAFRLFVNLLNP